MAAGSTMNEVARLRHVVETQNLLNSVGREPEEVMRVVAERARAITAAAGCVVEFRAGDQMVCTAASGLAEESPGLRLKAADSLSGRCVRLGVPIRCVDTEFDARVDRATCRLHGIRSMVVVPLVVGENPVGSLKVVSREPDHFGEADVEVLQEMARFITESGPPVTVQGQKVPDGLHDPLTGLANASGLAERLERACSGPDGDGAALAVFVVRVEGFGGVTSRYGDGAGEDLIRRVAGRLSGSVRRSDTLAHPEEDTFVLVCADASRSDAYGIATRISTAVRHVAESSPRYGGVSARVGLAWRDSEHPDPARLLAAADASMRPGREAPET